MAKPHTPRSNQREDNLAGFTKEFKALIAMIVVGVLVLVLHAVGLF